MQNAQNFATSWRERERERAHHADVDAFGGRFIRKGASATSDSPIAALPQEGEEGVDVLLPPISLLGKEVGAPNSSR
jgi:hypothetical protein